MTSNVSKLKVEMHLNLLQLAEKLGNVSAACRYLNKSREHYYEKKRRYEREGESGLKDRPRSYAHHSSRTPHDIEKKIIDFSLDHPAYSYKRIAGILMFEGIVISEGRVRGVMARNNLKTKKDRLKALSAKVEKEGIKLTAEQVDLLSRYSEKQVSPHIEAPFAGYLLCQDTFHVGWMKGVGRIYLQVVIDCANSFGFAKLYTSKVALTAAHVLNNTVLPFYKNVGIKVHRLLTDNGTEYCGRQYDHPYEVYLWSEEIHHSTTKVRSPQTNGYAERFNRTLLEEFFMVAFRKKFYSTLEDLQNDLNTYLYYYNFKRPHQGYRYPNKTPWQKFQLSLSQKYLPEPKEVNVLHKNQYVQHHPKNNVSPELVSTSKSG